MPLELQIIHTSDFIRLGPDEKIDFNSSKELLATLAHACTKRGIANAMLDVRALPIPPKPVFNSTELAALVMTFHAAGFSRKQKLAILYKKDPHGGARTFSFLSRMQGFQVRAFDNFEEAIIWLSQTEPEKSLPSAGKKVKVQFGPQKVTLRPTGKREACPPRKTRSHRA